MKKKKKMMKQEATYETESEMKKQKTNILHNL